jgi:hypothetical protein
MKTNQLLLALLLWQSPFLAGSQNLLDVSRLPGQIIFDGKLDEPFWSQLTPASLSQQTPNYGQAPTERSEIFLTYDNAYLYLAGRMFLSDSSYYRPTTFKRDAMDGTTDYFGFLIDSYNDNENALAFFTTPTGLRWDGTIANDALEDASMSTDWNTFWDAATFRTPWGWSAEIRIPWTSLRFQDKQGEVVMGTTIWWYIGAKNELDMFPLVPLNWGNMSSWKPSQMQKYHFSGVYSQKPLYLTPYVLLGYQETNELNENETAYLHDKDPKIEAGFDLKYSLTSNLTLDLTANTDFAQVEADDQQVNLTRFSLFFPEKRQFFQERASIFDFSFEDFNRLFYSRTIGIYEEDPVRIYGGARLQGRIGGHDLGFLSMQTAAPADSLRSENFTLLRVRRQAFNPFSYLGFIATNRSDFKGTFNSTYGFDAIVRVIADEYLLAKWAQSFEESRKNNPFSLNPSRFYLRWERRRYDGFAYNLTLSRAGEDWSPGMGFEEREDFFSIRGETSFGKLMGEDSKILSWRAFVKGMTLRNNSTDTLETTFLEPGFELQTKKGWFFNATLKPSHEYVKESFDLGEAEVPVGEYDFFQFSSMFFSPFGNLAGLAGNLAAGSFYDGNLITVSLSPRLKLSPRFQLEGFYQFNRGKFDKRGQAFNSHLGRLKAEYVANVKFSIAAFLQYNSLDEVFVPNVRLRYNPKEGNDLYVVLNDLLNSNRNREIPHLPFSESRAVVLKYTYTFRF